MFAWLFAIFRRQQESEPMHDDTVPERQEARQQQEFSAWADTLAEVERVQRQAAGITPKPKPVHVRRLHR